MDFGFGPDPSFVVKVYIIEETREIYIAKEATGTVTMEQLPGLIRSVIRDDDDVVFADSSQPGTIDHRHRPGV